MKTGIELIKEERRRQLSEEGWDSEHDDKHTDDQMAIAGACYALPEKYRFNNIAFNGKEVQVLWPWDSMWYKPTPDDRVRELTKAGALIAAEIDRLQRQE